MDRVNVPTQAPAHSSASYSLNPTIWEEWPELLDSVKVPHYFSASALASPFRCPIRSFGKAANFHGVMGPGIASLIGSAIHALIEDGILPCQEPLQEQIELLEVTIQKNLERFPPSQSLGVLPLEGKYRAMAVRSLAATSCWAVDKNNFRSAERRTYPMNSGLFKAGQRHLSQSRSEIQSSLLVEEPLRSKHWRLEGRADLIRVETNSVEIVDFKSGRIFGERGEILSGIILQMHAYALMAAERWPLYEIYLRVLGNEVMDVPNDSRLRRRVEELLIDLQAEFPSGRELNSVEVAKPGPSCRYCRLRPICSNYLKKAAKEWARTMPRKERISTNDVWGLYLENDHNFGAILLETPEGNKAKVFGLLPAEIDRLIPGSFIGIFGCETQGKPVPGRHPINWWIRRDGREVAGIRLFAQSR